MARLGGLAKLKVALDLRDIPREQVGTRTYAVNLARELFKLPEIELTLLVEHLAQAKGLNGRIVTSASWADDVSVIHKPAQVMNPADLRLLFESTASLAITYQDLIAFRIPLVFASESRFDTYRATSRLMLPAVQATIAISRSVQREIAAEFGIPMDEIALVMEAAETDAKPRIRNAKWRFRLPKRYFFSLASDYPHKNLPNLLDAYRQFRNCWTGGEPPELILAGYPSGARTSLYPQFEGEAAPEGVTFLGAVSNERLRALYKHAEALVFASVYEGFGLPPLEAMAVGVPVIVMPISAMPEVGGDAVLYADDLSSRALARALGRIACEEQLREDLRQKGLARAESFHWQKTAKQSLEVYKAAVHSPPQRSLRMRRLLRDVIIDWSQKNCRQAHDGAAHSLGISDSYQALKSAVQTRLRREFRRFGTFPIRVASKEVRREPTLDCQVPPRSI